MEGTKSSIPSKLNTIRLDHRIPIYRIHMLVYTLAIIAVIYHRITSNFASSTLVEAGLLWLISDLILAFMWACSQAFRWRPVHRHEFPARLPDQASWPALDVFVCTTDPHKEPPMGVVNAALSLLAFDYPPEKLSVYISDDGGADVTLFAFMEGAKFARHWLPFCRENGIKDRSPEVFFVSRCRCGGSDEDKLKIGFRYGSLVEDYYTGYRLHCEGWKSVFCNPPEPAFLGDAPKSLNDVLNQCKRWIVGLYEVMKRKDSSKDKSETKREGL